MKTELMVYIGQINAQAESMEHLLDYNDSHLRRAAKKAIAALNEAVEALEDAYNLAEDYPNEEEE